VTRTIEEYGLAVRRDGREALIAARPAGTAASFDALWERPEREARGELVEYLADLQEMDRLAAAIDRGVRELLYSIELQAIEAYRTGDTAAQARRIRCPTLVIHGRDDKVVPIEQARSLARAVPGSALVTIEGGGHGLMSRSGGARAAAISFMHRVDKGAQRQEGGPTRRRSWPSA
jgi:pimeloyl-ACP methyl ester carboxylesterase